MFFLVVVVVVVFNQIYHELSTKEDEKGKDLFSPDFKCTWHNDEYRLTGGRRVRHTTHEGEPNLVPKPSHLPGAGRRSTLGTSLRGNRELLNDLNK